MSWSSELAQRIPSRLPCKEDAVASLRQRISWCVPFKKDSIVRPPDKGFHAEDSMARAFHGGFRCPVADGWVTSEHASLRGPRTQLHISVRRWLQSTHAQEAPNSNCISQLESNFEARTRKKPPTPIAYLSQKNETNQ